MGLSGAPDASCAGSRENRLGGCSSKWFQRAKCGSVTADLQPRIYGAAGYQIAAGRQPAPGLISKCPSTTKKATANSADLFCATAATPRDGRTPIYGGKACWIILNWMWTRAYCGSPSVPGP